MDFLEMQTRVQNQARLNTNELATLIVEDLNAAYLQLSRRWNWDNLRVDGASFTTVANQVLYPLPAPFDRIVDGSVRYNYQSGTQQGNIIPVLTADSAQAYRAYGTGYSQPMIASITTGGSVYLSTGAVTTTNQTNSCGFTGSATSAWNGQWIAFHSDSSGNNGQGYPYLIASASGAAFSLTENYRGPNLNGASFEISPANQKQLLFDPPFNDSGGVVVVFGYYRRPRRLYNPQDVPEVEELCEAIIWKTLADNAIYHDKADADVFMQNAKSALKDAFATIS
jgi:hypothetical protein